MRARFYIDGFNFYYLRTKQQPQFKWLNLKKLANIIVPHGTIVERVNYYTAPVSGKIDPDAPRRQHALFSALATEPDISVHYGRFLFSEKWMALATPPHGKPAGYQWNLPPPDVVKVKRAEEKGSDVNFGVHLVRDAFLAAFDVAYVLTNDTDLVEPIRIVRDEVGLRVVVVAPCRATMHKGRTVPLPAPSLAAVSSAVHYIDDRELAAAQFPRVIQRPGKKPVVRPATWL